MEPTATANTVSISIPRSYAVWIYRYLSNLTRNLSPRESQPLFWLLEALRVALHVEPEPSIAIDKQPKI